jgi:hypothetical protein
LDRERLHIPGASTVFFSRRLASPAKNQPLY